MLFLNFFFFVSYKHFQIKENLNVTRKSDSLINIRLDAQKDTILEFVSDADLQKDGSATSYRPGNPDILGDIFDDPSWHHRICNPAGDFAFVNLSTLTFKLHQKKCLKEFVKNGNNIQEKHIFRGFQLICTFVKEYGNRYDLGLE